MDSIEMENDETIEQHHQVPVANGQTIQSTPATTQKQYDVGAVDVTPPTRASHGLPSVKPSQEKTPCSLHLAASTSAEAVFSSTQVDSIMQDALIDLMSHESFDEFCQWRHVTAAHYKQDNLNMDDELSHWLGFLRVNNVSATGPTEQYMKVIKSQMTEDPMLHPKFDIFSIEFRKAPGGRHPFCSLANVVQDFDSFGRWKQQDLLLNEIMTRTLTKALMHCMWPSYVQHCVAQGAEEEDFASFEMVMLGDPEETLNEWNAFLQAAEWVQKDLG
jgi:hypothetical protein